MNENRILIIGLVWPEPGSSAAGTRMIQLVHLFLSRGYEVVFASAASKSEFSFNLQEIGVSERGITLNDTSFNLFLQEIKPGMVLFDRFVMEEQYGWRVQEECPDAMRILDTEDLHCLRNARQQALKNNRQLDETDLFSDMAKREIAAILRCDLSLIISEVEMKILQEQFQVDPALIYYLPFLEEELSEEDIRNWNTFEEREGFVFIGNFLHEPNWHTVQTLKTKIWPLLRKKIPAASLHIYGAYATQKVMQLHNEKERFHIHGRAKHARECISNHRILLAPIQFGAGLKGKFIDAMQVGTPAVTTTIGAEAMTGGMDWNGEIADDLTAFADQAAALYQDKNRWLLAQQNGALIINKRYGKSVLIDSFIKVIKTLSADLTGHRRRNFFGQILQYHTANSTKYMSLWIAEKKRP
ncbi:Glycosyltransferase involved in cell wall bisynthesis [Pedobacter steynii]|uniref:Glycosyltransferase involved in cell wall bisynthesis n=1 Tax=Pedobacter steynii TaxID=430522 RepID=A0A1G9RDC2_9SPHI|nr:glycosyltransferase family 4 protein [Pedobacter steynii]NQX37812.1 glycosyltransferase family 4 protein [Pedobacter steynii]SDM20445.1 Glycosyltransferase involved in cell wall bisynthesis [Pedobacter steynii]